MASAGEEDGPPGPDAVPGYELVSLLGRGGFSRVFAARRSGDARVVALKLARLRNDPRFPREAWALRRVGPPAVPRLLDEGSVEGWPFLAMEALEGAPLADWLAALPGAGAAPFEDAVRLFRLLCQAVASVHQHRVVHRDLKPENVFLLRDGGLSLIDLGLARGIGGVEAEAPSADVTREGQQPGTAMYMSPEQCVGGVRISPASDVYSLGVVLFELLTGRPPFAGEGADVLRGHASLRPPRPSSLEPRAAPLDDFVLQCLAKEPERRFAGAAEALTALERAIEQLPRAPVSAAPAPAAPVSTLRPVVVLGVGGGASVTELAAAVEPEGGFVARVDGDLTLVTFHEHPSPAAGLKAAMRAAWRWGRGRRVLHLADLRVRSGAAGTRLAGAGLDGERAWWAAAPPDARAWVTPEAVALLWDRGFLEAAAGRHFALPEQAGTLPGDELAEGPLVGRDALLAGLEADAREASRTFRPTLLTLSGETGMGKTRLLEALAEALARIPGARVEALRAEDPEAGAPGRVLARLLALGPGLSSEEALARVRDVPPESRGHALARLLGEGLRRRASTQPLLLLLDDAHFADAVVLDALELATLSEAGAPLWIVLTCRPELVALRPHLGERAGLGRIQSLEPLAPEDAHRLLLALLRPVEYVPRAALEHLASLARGVPLYLVELVLSLRAAGAIRRELTSGAWTLAPDELLHVSSASLVERLGERSLSALPGNLRALARLCAVLGDGLTGEDVAAVQRQLDVDPELAGLSTLDPGVGLARLVRAGVLEPRGGGHFAFRHPLLREALERGLPMKLRRSLHRAALHGLPGADPEPAVLLRRARHAAEAGERDTAAAAYLRLAEDARLDHRDLSAEQSYSAAIEQLSTREPEPLRRALAGRGRVRHRSHRYAEARSDLRRAAELALAGGDQTAAAGILLEEATVLDLMEDFDGSEAMTRQAVELGGAAPPAGLAARLTLARGRLALRLGKLDESCRLLEEAAAGAELSGEPEARAIALSLWATVLAYQQHLDEAEAVFERALAHCEATGDRLHLAVTYLNRCLLWQNRQDMERALADLRLNLALARELGHAQIERISTYNLADYLHRLGRWSEALPLARRAHELGQRFFREHPVAADALLLARIGAASGDHLEARRQLDWLENHPGHALGPQHVLYQSMVRQALADAGNGGFSRDAWAALLEGARRDCEPDHVLELLVQAAAQAREAGAGEDLARLLTQARELLPAAPIWRARMESLGRARVL